MISPTDGGGTRTASPRRSVAAAFGAAVLLTAGLAGCSAAEPEDRSVAARPPAPVVVTTGPLREAPAPSPSVRPMPAGTVSLGEGPFNDRFAVRKLTLARGDRPAVVLVIQVTSDVSELLLLQARAAFYDGQGRLVAQGETTYQPADPDAHLAEHGPTAVTVRSAVSAPGAVAAVVTVPALVNE